ncbi:hypothetical protein MP228_002218 [Amoeboaphelidium protococcarum]|nr:hypothetical protein MP228_002218 [Amoeboaphelidium protococcarum]
MQSVSLSPDEQSNCPTKQKKAITSPGKCNGQMVAKVLQEDVLKCSECKHDIPRTDDSANILCAGCANKLKLNALSQVGDGGDKSVKVHTSVGHLGPSLEEYQPQKLVMEAEPGKRVFGLTFGRSSSNQRVNDIHSDIVDGFLKELMMPLQWTSSGKEVIPGLAGRTLINGAHQFGNGAFEYSMLAKLSRSNGRVYAYVPLDLKSNGCTEEDIVIMAMTCPDNFGTGNPYHLVEFLKYVATMAPVSLDNVYLASIGTQQEEVLVVNELNVVCAQDIIICLCDGVWPVDDNKYTHLMRFLYRMAQGVLARRFTGNNLSRNFTSDSHHVVAYQHEFQQSSPVQQQSSSQQSSRKQSSQQQSSSRYPCDHPACGAVLNFAAEYRTHVAQHQLKVDQPFRRMEKNCDKAHAEKWHLTRHWDESTIQRGKNLPARRANKTLCVSRLTRRMSRDNPVARTAAIANTNSQLSIGSTSSSPEDQTIVISGPKYAVLVIGLVEDAFFQTVDKLQVAPLTAELNVLSSCVYLLVWF